MGYTLFGLTVTYSDYYFTTLPYAPLRTIRTDDNDDDDDSITCYPYVYIKNRQTEIKKNVQFTFLFYIED